MNYIDYKGKLNNHKKYKEIINALEGKCNYIEIVSNVRTGTNELINQLKDDIIFEGKVSKWCGTTSKGKSYLYKIIASKKLFDLLRQYETFCKYYVSPNGDYSKTTDFGLDDIAFFDNIDKPLLYTTTHEGYITIRDDFYI